MVFPKFLIDETPPADGARSDPLRPRLRPSRSVPAGVSVAGLPDDATRPGRRVAGPAGYNQHYYELFNGILNPKQLEGLRLLVTPFPQQQFTPPRIAVASSPASGRLLRLPSERAYQRGHPPGRRYRPPGIPSSHRDAVVTRG